MDPMNKLQKNKNDDTRVKCNNNEKQILRWSRKYSFHFLETALL